MIGARYDILDLYGPGGLRVFLDPKSLVMGSCGFRIQENSNRPEQRMRSEGVCEERGIDDPEDQRDH
jgi:hypothetical protein